MASQPRVRSETGQALPEYAVIVAAVAVFCILAIVFLAAGVGQLFGSTDKPTQPGPLQPPLPSAQPTYPTRAEECEDGGWREFPQFRNEADCKKYVESLQP